MKQDYEKEERLSDICHVRYGAKDNHLWLENIKDECFECLLRSRLRHAERLSTNSLSIS